MGSVWHWETIDPNRLNASGNLSKAFKNEASKAPGVFAQGAPSDEATLLVREAIQNSWDSALEMRRELRLAGNAPPPFEVRFRFRTVSGSAREHLIEALGLSELGGRAATVDDRSKLGLGATDCLDGLNEPGDLHLLEVVEQAAGGMHGPWVGDRSRMFLALCSTGMTTGVEGRGGSYGYGKAGLIRGSMTRTVIAYSCFAERHNDPRVTRRLLGMTYWDKHSIGDDDYLGAGRLGHAESEEVVVPFTNGDADSLAQRLGLPIRNPDLVADLGTSFLLVEPTMEPEDLVAAVERNWWPALEEASLHFNVVVEDAGGEVHNPRPRRSATLRSFIDAYEAATVPQDNRSEYIRTRNIRQIGKFDTPGTLGLVADPPGWSYPDNSSGELGEDHRSLVALIREPRMVVEYLDAGHSMPYIRGCFVADNSINEALRLTEPKGHDAWQTQAASGDFDPEYAELAKEISKRIKSNLNNFRNDLKSPPKPSDSVRLPEFDRLMKSLLSGGGGGTKPPPVEERPFTIQPGGELETTEDGLVRLKGRARIAFSQHHIQSGGAGREVEIKIHYGFREGDRIGGRALLMIEQPPSFALHSGRIDTFRGVLEPGDTLDFNYESEEYDPTWTGQLLVTADLVSSQDSILLESDSR